MNVFIATYFLASCFVLLVFHVIYLTVIVTGHVVMMEAKDSTPSTERTVPQHEQEEQQQQQRLLLRHKRIRFEAANTSSSSSSSFNQIVLSAPRQRNLTQRFPADVIETRFDSNTNAIASTAIESGKLSSSPKEAAAAAIPIVDTMNNKHAITTADDCDQRTNFAISLFDYLSLVEGQQMDITIQKNDEEIITSFTTLLDSPPMLSRGNDDDPILLLCLPASSCYGIDITFDSSLSISLGQNEFDNDGHLYFKIDDETVMDIHDSSTTTSTIRHYGYRWGNCDVIF